jgi:hypothetical protein
MVEYKVTGKNKLECATDYINNHLGEEIIFVNNGEHHPGWLEHITACTREHIWRLNDEHLSLYVSVNEIAKYMYICSHKKF